MFLVAPVQALSAICTKKQKPRLVTETNTSPSQLSQYPVPGFTRINIPYFYDEETADYIISSIRKVAEEGWKLLPYYKYSVSNASYRHVNIGKARNKFSLNDIKYDSNGFHDLALADDSTLTDDTNRLDLKTMTKEAEKIFRQAENNLARIDSRKLSKKDPFGKWTWFVTVNDVMEYVNRMGSTASNRLSKNRPHLEKSQSPTHERQRLKEGSRFPTIKG
ncbi:hypothetical protein ScPMuIL_016658 [Solemya velum]